jgi:hypothetical protein
LSDLLTRDDLAAGLQALLPDISRLKRHHLPRDKAELLYEVTWRLGELENCSDCVERLAGLLEAHTHDLHSRALGRLRRQARAAPGRSRRSTG